MKIKYIAYAALAAAMVFGCTKSDEPEPEKKEQTEPEPEPEPEPDPDPDPDPNPDPDPDPEQPKERWTDTGADLPDYPTYNKVSRLEDFPRIDITWDSNPNLYRLAEGEFEYVNGTIKFSDPKGMYKPSESAEFDFDNSSVILPMRIRCRGNTSWNAEGGIKNAYRIKLQNEGRTDKEPHRLFGMNKDSDWYLLADVQDPTLLRNAVAQRIARMVSMPWSPKYRCVEVYRTKSSGGSEYLGCYLLCEAKEADRNNKAPITIVESGQEPDQGGYLLEIDNKQDYDRYFRTEKFNKKIKFKEPDFGNRNNPDNSASASAQMNYITEYVNEVERLLKAYNFDTETGYRSRMEVGTFIGNYLVQEIMKNTDGGMRLSTYFAKDSDTKLFMPFVWDFDLTLGNYNGSMSRSFNLSDGDSPEGWLIRVRGGSFEDGDTYGSKKSYYQYLFEDPLFVQELKDYWELVKPRLDKIPTFIKMMTEYNSLAYDHNSQAGKNPRANNRGSGMKNFSSWQEAVNDMKDFYTRRIAWLDTNIKSLKAQHFDADLGYYVDK